MIGPETRYAPGIIAAQQEALFFWPGECVLEVEPG